MRSNLEGARISGCLLMEGNKFGVLAQTLGATLVMDADMHHVLFLDPGGSGREVRLPAEAKGLWFTIVNTADAAEALTVKEDSGTTTIGTIGQNEVGQFFCDGTTWWGNTQADVTNLAVGGTLTVTGATALNGNVDVGNAITDTVGFYGATKVAQGASASQAAVTLTAVSAIATTVLSAAYTGMWAFSSSTVAQTWRTRINQLRVDVTAMNVLMTAVRKALVPTTGVGLIKGAA